MDGERRSAVLTVEDAPGVRPEDVTSPEALVQAVYETISGPAEQEEAREWDRLRGLFLPGARFVLPRWRTPGGEVRDELRAWDVESFIEASREHYAESALHEREIARRVDRFGHIAHVFSTYEARAGSGECEAVSRGINSVQTIRHGGRWWIAHLMWDVQAPASPLPEMYGPGSE